MNRCKAHGLFKRGYVVCTHVMMGATVTHFSPSTGPGPDGLGEALCTTCNALCAAAYQSARAGGLSEPPVDRLRVVCPQCLVGIAARMN